jgi:hypothetical protein
MVDPTYQKQKIEKTNNRTFTINSNAIHILLRKIENDTGKDFLLQQQRGEI